MSLETQQPPKNEYLLGFASTQQHRDQREALLPVDPGRGTLPFGVVLVDASADVSSSMTGDPRLRVLPLAVRWPGRSLMEKGSRSRLRHLSREALRGARVAPPAVESLAFRLYPPLVINADWLIHVGTRRELIDVAHPLQQLLDTHADEIRDMRRQRGLDEKLNLALAESGSLLAGTALQARLLLHMLHAGVPAAEVARRAHGLREHTRLWLLPQHPGDTLEALQRLGQPALSPWEQACARPLRHLLRRAPVLQADAGAMFCDRRAKNWRQAVVSVFEEVGALLRGQPAPGAWLQISLDGSLRDLQAWPEFDALRQQAVASRTPLHVTHMSPAGRIWASAGSLSVALYLPPTDAA
ncbi:MAG: DegV family protein [Betaproteobacteria bacterium]|nr:DegV family protein [Betaproteobacteria bacterium]